MKYYVLIPFLFFIVNSFTLIYIHSHFKKNRVSYSYIICAWLVATWTFIDFLIAFASKGDGLIPALLKLRSMGWLLIGPATLNVALALTDKKQKAFLGFFSGASLFIFVLNLGWGHLFLGCIETKYGVFNKNTGIFNFSVILCAVIPLCYSAFILIKSSMEDDKKPLKKEFKLIAFSIIFSLVSGLSVNFFLPLFFDIHSARFASSVSVIISLSFFVILRKYQFFKIDIKDLSGVLFNSIDGIIVINFKGKIELMNKSAEYFLNVDANKVKNMDISVLIEDYDYLRDYYNFEIRPKNNERLTIALFQSSLSFSDAELGKLLILKNITGRVEAEKENKQKTDFLAIMSHELRTPLTGIIGFSDILSKDISLTKKQGNFIGRINKLGRKLLKLINDLLEISIIESGKVQIKYEKFDINDIIYEAFMSFEEEINEKDLEITENTNDIEEIYSSPLRVRQLLINLIGNAVKYTDRGRIHIEVKEEDGKYIFCVEDTGIGISKKDQVSIFDMFKQVDATIKRSGSGIGLAICKKLAGLLNGKLWLESEENVGTKFYFQVPVLKTSSDDIHFHEGHDNAKADIKNLKILFAEDDPNNFFFISELLSIEKNKSFKGFEDGLPLVREYKDNRDYNVIVLDIQMKNMNGVETLEEIRKLNKDIPVIALTAFAMESDKKKYLDIGFTDYIEKPIDINKFLATLSKYSENISSV
jgi:signal transduction histidine kinase